MSAMSNLATPTMQLKNNAILLFAITLVFTFTTVKSFGTAHTRASSLITARRSSALPFVHSSTLSSSSLSSSSTVDSESSSSSSYPALTDKEIEDFLSNTPVYAITVSQQEKVNGGGLVMLSEPDNSYNIACFFFNPLHANAIFAPLREKSNIKWDITAFSLGSIWMDLMKNDFTVSKKDGIISCIQDQVEYRILPDPNDLLEARNLLTAAASSEEGLEVPSVFRSSYNEIPVFFHDKLRLMADATDGQEQKVVFPMYFSLQDLKDAHGQSGEEMKNYNSEVKIGDLRTIVQQMQSDSATTDFRNVMLVPSSPPAQPSSSSTSPSSSEVEKKAEDDTDGNALNLPTTGDWSD